MRTLAIAAALIFSSNCFASVEFRVSVNGGAFGAWQTISGGVIDLGTVGSSDDLICTSLTNRRFWRQTGGWPVQVNLAGWHGQACFDA